MKHYLRDQITASLKAMGVADGIIPSFEKPRIAEHGDLTTNVAMVVGKQMKTQPKKVAEQIVEKLQIDRSLVDSIEIAGPGFLNFFIKNEALLEHAQKRSLFEIHP